jgi:hypothetical protein
MGAYKGTRVLNQEGIFGRQGEQEELYGSEADEKGKAPSRSQVSPLGRTCAERDSVDRVGRDSLGMILGSLET